MTISDTIEEGEINTLKSETKKIESKSYLPVLLPSSVKYSEFFSYVFSPDVELKMDEYVRVGSFKTDLKNKKPCVSLTCFPRNVTSGIVRVVLRTGTQKHQFHMDFKENYIWYPTIMPTLDELPVPTYIGIDQNIGICEIQIEFMLKKSYDSTSSKIVMGILKLGFI